MPSHQISTTKDRFDAKVLKGAYSTCWIWTGARNPAGYGNIRGFKSETMKAHRLSWIMHRGDIPKGMNVCHHCDNPPCVNPDHLFIGTFQDNTADCKSKGRLRSGPLRRAKTHCSRGHIFDDKNTYWTKSGLRACRACHNLNHRRYRVLRQP